MAQQKSPAKVEFDKVVACAVTPVLKAAGFRKSGMNYHRRVADVVQVVNLQTSLGGTWNRCSFFVNVGLTFDVLCRMAKVEVLEKPSEAECDARGTRDRLEALITGCPNEWSIDAEGASDQLNCGLKQKVCELAEELQMIDGIQAYRQHRWFNRFRPKGENVQIMCALGDMEGAWAELCELCTLFADRQGANRPEWWLDALGCPELAKKLGHPILHFPHNRTWPWPFRHIPRLMLLSRHQLTGRVPLAELRRLGVMQDVHLAQTGKRHGRRRRT